MYRELNNIICSCNASLASWHTWVFKL